MIAAFAASILFATSITCGHRATKLIGGASANFWRLLIATILLGIWSCSFGIGFGGAGFTFFFVSVGNCRKRASAEDRSERSAQAG